MCNFALKKDQTVEPAVPAPTRSYGRKRKLAAEEASKTEPAQTIANQSSDTTSLTLLPQSENHNNLITMDSQSPFDEKAPNEVHDEPKKVSRGRAKRQNQNQFNGSHEQHKSSNNNDISPSFELDKLEQPEENYEKPSVKLVISKKKGSIFKSRAIEADSGESTKQKRHVYKHKWDDDSPEDKGSAHDA